MYRRRAKRQIFPEVAGAARGQKDEIPAPRIRFRPETAKLELGNSAEWSAYMTSQRLRVTKPASSGPMNVVGSKPVLFTGANSHPILKLQQSIGNRAVQRLIESEFKRSAEENSNEAPAPGTIVNAALNSSGKALDPATRALMESSFGTDFAGVRLHTDALAAESAAKISAHAYTSGKDIVFAQGSYDPGTPAGQRLIAHELAHVVQQGSGQVAGTLTADGSLSISNPEDTFEQEADARAENVVEGATGKATQSAGEAAPGVSVQRDDDETNDMLSTGQKVATPPAVWHALNELNGGAEATETSIESAEGVAKSWEGFEGTLGPLPAGIAAAAEGSPGFMDTVRAAQFEEGLGGTAGTGLGNYLAPAALISGGIDVYDATKDMSEHGANLENTPDLVKGGLEATSGGIGTLGLAGAGLSAVGATGAGEAAIGAAAAAAPVGMVAGAGALGMLAGTGMAKIADSSYTKTGAFGVDEDTGQNRSAMDWGANWGTNWDKAHNKGETSITGGILAGLGGIVGGIGGAVYGAGHWLGENEDVGSD
jgi:hypothetical protein